VQALQDNGSDPGSESESDSEGSSESDSEEFSQSEGSTNGCDEGARLLQSRNVDSSADEEVDVGLKGRSISGIVEAVVRVRISEDVITTSGRESSASKDSVSVVKTL